jgi:hypothetical protein
MTFRTIAAERPALSPILKVADHRHSKLRQPSFAEIGQNVKLKVLSILLQCGAFESGRFTARNPAPTGFGDRDALGVGNVDATADLDADFCVVGIGVPFAREGLNVTVAFLIGVIDDPGFLLLALSGCPCSLPN